MGQKVYKPIIKDGDHLVRSKEHPERVRGLSRDGDNKNQDIPEFEEVDLEDLREDNGSEKSVLTAQQKEIADQIGTILGTAILAGMVYVTEKQIKPWWQRKALPWLSDKMHKIVQKITGKDQKDDAVEVEVIDDRYPEVSERIDPIFKEMYYQMSEPEARQHVVNLIYHMLGMINEIRIISNSQISKESNSKEEAIKHQKESEQYLVSKVSENLNNLLSNEDLNLDLNTSKELMNLTGGGVYLNGTYMPVQPDKIKKAMLAIDENSKNKSGDSD